MDRLSGEQFLRSIAYGGLAASGVPAVDVAETADTVIVTATVPDIRPEDVTITFAMPAPVTSDKAQAEFQNGLLKLILPTAEVVRPKTITVKIK